MALPTIFDKPGKLKDTIKEVKVEMLNTLSYEELKTLIVENYGSVGSVVISTIGEFHFMKWITKSNNFFDRGKPSERGETSKVDRYIEYIPTGTVYSVQVKEILAGSIKKQPNGCATGTISLKMTDKQKTILPSTGKSLVTSHSLRNRFQILAVPLYPFTGNIYDFAYMLNTDIPTPVINKTSSLRNHDLTKEELQDLLPLEQKLIYPLPIGGCWTSNLPSLLERCDDLSNTKDYVNHRVSLIPTTADDVLE